MGAYRHADGCLTDTKADFCCKPLSFFINKTDDSYRRIANMRSYFCEVVKIDLGIQDIVSMEGGKAGLLVPRVGSVQKAAFMLKERWIVVTGHSKPKANPRAFLEIHEDGFEGYIHFWWLTEGVSLRQHTARHFDTR